MPTFDCPLNEAGILESPELAAGCARARRRLARYLADVVSTIGIEIQQPEDPAPDGRPAKQNSGRVIDTILVTLYIFTEGSRSDEDGGLIYYRYL